MSIINDSHFWSFIICKIGKALRVMLNPIYVASVNIRLITPKLLTSQQETRKIRVKPLEDKTSNRGAKEIHGGLSSQYKPICSREVLALHKNGDDNRQDGVTRSLKHPEKSTEKHQGAHVRCKRQDRHRQTCMNSA